MQSMPSLCPDLSTRGVLMPVTYPFCDELVQSLLDPSPRLVRLSSLRDSRYDYRFAFGALGISRVARCIGLSSRQALDLLLLPLSRPVAAVSIELLAKLHRVFFLGLSSSSPFR